MHESETYGWLLPLLMPPATKKGCEFLGVVAMFHVVLAEDFYHLLGIYSLHVMQWKNNLHFFFHECEVSKAGPCWAANRQSWQRHEFFSSYRPPFLSLSLFSCRFSRYAAWTRGCGCMRSSRAASPQFHQPHKLAHDFENYKYILWAFVCFS